jgi:hypothetical protein
VLAAIFALATFAAGIDVEDVAAGALAVFVGVMLVAVGRPPFATVRVPTASSVAAWSAVATLSAAGAAVSVRWGFAMLSLAAAASAGVLWRRRRDAKERGLI